jgi:hypothetical protein
VKLASSATATKYSSCRSSITTDASSKTNPVFDFWLRGPQAGRRKQMQQ